MNTIDFHCPTKIFFGEGCVENNSSQFSALGNKALIVTGGNSSKRNGSLDDVTKALEKEGIYYEIFNEVEQNPSVASVFKGSQLAKSIGAKFIVGIGGGSPMDAAKAVAVLAVNQISPQELMAKKWHINPLPVIAVPTTAGTGSEVTPYAVLTVDWAETKISIGGEKLFPAVALLDGRYMLGLPWKITANTALDALSHSMEGYINKRSNAVSDLLALEGIRIISELFKTIKPDEISLPQREALLYASMLGGMVIAQTGTNVVHALGYPLTYYKGLPHGLANGILLKAALEFMAQDAPGRVQQVVAAMGCQDIPEVGTLLNTILPIVDTKLNINEQELYINKTLQVKNIGSCPKTPNEKDLLTIIKGSNLV